MFMAVCTARNYLNRAGRPTHPNEREMFDWLEYAMQPDSIQISLRPRGRYATNDPLVLIDWLQAGRGAGQSFCLSRFDYCSA